MAALTALAMATAAGASLSGAYAQSQALKAQGETARATGEVNTTLANVAAEDAIVRGDREAVRIRKQAGVLAGRQRAAAGASGVEVDSGSAADVVRDTNVMGALDAVTVRNNAWREAMGYRVQAIDATARGRFAEIGGNAASRASILTGSLEAAGYGTRGVYYATGGK